jgi:membrane-associated phospholipid phosphatase
MIRGVAPTIEILLALVIALLIWRAQHRALLLDLIPFLLLLLSFQALRSFADNYSPADIHILDLIGYEKALFGGTIPAYFVQSTIIGKPFAPLIEIPSSLFYMSHFVVPLIVAIILWYRKRSTYWPFVIGLVLLSYAGFITYLLYPAAPPWWATKYGYLVDQPVILTAYAFPTLVEFAGPNPVAAMPSLHMAWPTYITLFCIYVWGRKIAWMLILPLGVGFSTLLLGHHYVVDLFFGILFGVFFFMVVYTWMHKRNTEN